MRNFWICQRGVLEGEAPLKKITSSSVGGSDLRGVRGASPLSKILPLPLDKGKGIKGIGLLR
jgi:hypothetical protein